MSGDRPLGEARVLWEIGEQGCDVRALRRRLDLDSGYLSRLLRSLEGDGLVSVGPGERDRRVRTARLTAAGVRERAALDRSSDAFAASLLEPLGEAQRARLVRAMAEVERLLSAPLVTIEPVDPDDPRGRYCLGEYAAELARRFRGGFDPARSVVTASSLRPPAGLLLVASLHEEPVGCGGLRFHDGEPTEVKRMWVAGAARGLGLGRRLLGELERRAAERHPVVHLETNASLTEAIALYRSSGYTEVAAFNDEVYGDHWFEKRLGPTSRVG
jgi:DNA-binding MarR family transcriptional regulator/ribosomal protein S18 acetylase RimI-like enzyme